MRGACRRACTSAGPSRWQTGIGNQAAAAGVMRLHAPQPLRATRCKGRRAPKTGRSTPPGRPPPMRMTRSRPNKQLRQHHRSTAAQLFVLRSVRPMLRLPRIQRTARPCMRPRSHVLTQRLLQLLMPTAPHAWGPGARLQAAAAVVAVVLQRGRAPLGCRRRRGGRRALALRAGQPSLRFRVILHGPQPLGESTRDQDLSL